MAFTDYYRTLGLPRFYVTPEEIQEAYHKRRDFFHPDNGNVTKDFSDIVTPQIEIAYAVLSDPARKQEYDKVLARYVNEPVPKTFSVDKRTPAPEKEPIKEEIPKKVNFKKAYCVLGIVVVCCALGVFLEFYQDVADLANRISVASAIQYYFLVFLGGTLGFAVEYRVTSVVRMILGLLSGFIFTSEKVNFTKKIQWISTVFYLSLGMLFSLAFVEWSIFPICWAVTLWIFAPGAGQTITLIFEKRFQQISPFSCIMTAIFGAIMYAVMLRQIITLA